MKKSIISGIIIIVAALFLLPYANRTCKGPLGYEEGNNMRQIWMANIVYNNENKKWLYSLDDIKNFSGCELPDKVFYSGYAKRNNIKGPHFILIPDNFNNEYDTNNPKDYGKIVMMTNPTIKSYRFDLIVLYQDGHFEFLKRNE